MGTYNIAINKARKRISIIRSKEKIEEYLDEYEFRKKEKSGFLDNEMRKEVTEAVIEEELDETEEEQAPQFKTRFIQEFVFSNENTPIELSLDKVQEDMLPISVVREEIQKSYDKGMEDGQLTSRATFQTEVEKYQEWVRQIDTVVDNLKAEHRDAINKFEASLIDLSFLIAEQIIGLEVHRNDNIIIKQVKRAIDSIDSEKIYRIHLHPSTLEILEEFKSHLLEDEEESKKIVLYADKNIPLGGCVIETSAGLIDGRLKHQLKELKKILSEEVYKPMEDSERKQELDAIYAQEGRSTKSHEFELSEEAQQKVDEISDFDYDDMPDEYKEMFSPDLFEEGNIQDLDAEGNIIVPEEKVEEEIDEDYDPLSEFGDIDFELDDPEQEIMNSEIDLPEQSIEIDDSDSSKYDSLAEFDTFDITFDEADETDDTDDNNFSSTTEDMNFIDSNIENTDNTTIEEDSDINLEPEDEDIINISDDSDNFNSEETNDFDEFNNFDDFNDDDANNNEETD